MKQLRGLSEMHGARVACLYDLHVDKLPAALALRRSVVNVFRENAQSALRVAGSSGNYFQKCYIKGEQGNTNEIAG
jgi:hypothetical protein